MFVRIFKCKMIRLFIMMNPFKNFGMKLANLNSAMKGQSFLKQLATLFNQIRQTTFIQEFFRRYKSNFLAKVFNEYVS